MCCASASHARQVTSLRWWFCVTRCQGDFDNARFHYTVARRLASSHDAPLINANLAKLDAAMTTTTTSSRTISIAQQRQQPQQQQRQRRRRRAGNTSLVTSTNEQCASNRHCHSLHRHHRYPSTTSYNVSSYLCVSCHYYSNDSRLNRRWWYGRQFATTAFRNDISTAVYARDWDRCKQTPVSFRFRENVIYFLKRFTT